MDYGLLLLAVVIVVLVVVLGSAGVERRLNRMERRLARMERKLDTILEGLDILRPEPELDQVKAFLLQGKKIQAIKAYRESTGADLKEAKDAVDRLAGQY